MAHCCRLGDLTFRVRVLFALKNKCTISKKNAKKHKESVSEVFVL